MFLLLMAYARFIFPERQASGSKLRKIEERYFVSFELIYLDELGLSSCR